MLRKTLFIIGLLALFLLAGIPTPAEAATFDVTNATQLQTVLATAASNDEDDTINLAAGTYQAPVGSFVYAPSTAAKSNHSLALIGSGASSTILTGNNLRRVLFIDSIDNAGNPSLTIRLEGMTIRDGKITAPTELAGGAYIQTKDISIDVRDCIFTNNHADTTNSIAGAAYFSSFPGLGHVRLINNVVYQNSAADFAGGFYISVANGPARLINNTIYDNSVSTGVQNAGVFIDSTGNLLNSFDLVNNIIFNNHSNDGVSRDIYIDVDPVLYTILLSHNTFGLNPEAFVCVGCTNLSESGNILQNPLLVDPANGDFHLSAESPCIEKGVSVTLLPVFDIERDPRVIGASPDIGADEFSACGDGFINDNAGEFCDDGDATAGDGCSASCQVEAGYTCSGTPSICQSTCGDGILDAGEECDDGNTSNNDDCVEGCKMAKCTDGFLQAGFEQCDDGNTNDNDGCHNNCTDSDDDSGGCSLIRM